VGTLSPLDPHTVVDTVASGFPNGRISARNDRRVEGRGK
jgi:hypothetical protein